MHAANDESASFAHGVGARRPAYLFVLIGLGCAYGLLLLLARLSPQLGALVSSGQPAPGELKLPLLAQIASLLAGIAALVLVLSHAVRKVDTRPYLAIAPFIAVFAGLVHAGVRMDLSRLGLSAAYVAFGALGVALLGGALIARRAQGQGFGWLLVIAPGAIVTGVVMMAKGQTELASSERAFLVGLFASTLLLGGAGIAARRLRRPPPDEEISIADELDDPTFFGSHADPRASTLGTRVRATAPVQMAARVPRRAAPSSRGRMKTGAMLGAVAVAAYFGVDQLKRGERDAQPELAASVGLSADTVPVVEQLSEPNKRGGRASSARHERSAKSAASGVSSISASKPSRRASAPEPKPARSGRSSSSTRSYAGATTRASTPVALPAWGAEAMREFEAPKADNRRGKKAGKAAMSEPAPIAEPPQPSTSMSSSRSLAMQKRVEPPKPVTPPPPSKPLTMDQLLNRVEAAAQAQRSKKGVANKPKSQSDSELDALINQAVHSKKK